MRQSSINFRIDSDLKKQMEETCKALGISLSSALTMYVTKVVREQRIPFDVAVDPFYSEENQQRLKEAIQALEAGEKTLKYHDLMDD